MERDNAALLRFTRPAHEPPAFLLCTIKASKELAIWSWLDSGGRARAKAPDLSKVDFLRVKREPFWRWPLFSGLVARPRAPNSVRRNRMRNS